MNYEAEGTWRNYANVRIRLDKMRHNMDPSFYFSIKPTDALVSKFILVQNST